MDPWKQTLLNFLRDIMRFALWSCIALIGLMTAVFSIAFVYQFLRHLWSWCSRVLFSSSW